MVSDTRSNDNRDDGFDSLLNSPWGSQSYQNDTTEQSQILIQ